MSRAVRCDVRQHQVLEVSLGRPWEGAVNSPEVDVTFVGPDGAKRRVPAFVGGGEWRVRYSSAEVGEHRFQVEGSAATEVREGSFQVLPAVQGDRSLRARGPIRVASDGRHFAHHDGTPFMWVGDTWWEGFVSRISEKEFEEFAGKRAEQGFSVIQIVAGLYPEMGPFAPEGASNSGWAWEEGFSAPNMAWFDEADRRVQCLLDNDLVPCLFGAWAYYLEFMDASQLLRHWREMIARWAAYPVVWCVVGEVGIVWYEDQRLLEYGPQKGSSYLTDFELCHAMAKWAEADGQLEDVAEVAQGIRELDPFGRPLTVHPVFHVDPWEMVTDDLVDFWMLQTGHNGFRSFTPSVDAVHRGLARAARKPVLNGEVCYEGIAGSSWQEIQRLLFWSHMLSGAAGHTYGAMGIWAFNTPEFDAQYSGKAPNWTEAAELPGAAQVALGGRLLADLPWSEFEPRPDWAAPHQHDDDRTLLYAAGVEGGPRVVYVPSYATSYLSDYAGARLRGLGDGRWRMKVVDPRTGEVERQDEIEPDADGTALLRAGHLGLTMAPSWEDWLVVLEPIG